jgi:hypothetical protein
VWIKVTVILVNCIRISYACKLLYTGREYHDIVLMLIEEDVAIDDIMCLPIGTIKLISRCFDILWIHHDDSGKRHSCSYNDIISMHYSSSYSFFSSLFCFNIISSHRYMANVVSHYKLIIAIILFVLSGSCMALCVNWLSGKLY